MCYPASAFLSYFRRTKGFDFCLPFSIGCTYYENHQPQQNFRENKSYEAVQFSSRGIIPILVVLCFTIELLFSKIPRDWPHRCQKRRKPCFSIGLSFAEQKPEIASTGAASNSSTARNCRSATATTANHKPLTTIVVGVYGLPCIRSMLLRYLERCLRCRFRLYPILCCCRRSEVVLWYCRLLAK